MATQTPASASQKIVAYQLNGRLVDVASLPEGGQALPIQASSPEGLEVLRHSCAHVLAQAVKQLYPQVQVTIGPVIEEGFYYDFASPMPFSVQDLEAIEARMHEIAAKNLPVRRIECSRAEAIERFEAMGEHYKVEIIRSIPEDEILSLYEQGDFVDLCRGPHVPSTGFLTAFKLMRVAGAYWRGDSSQPMLQRIYGTAFAEAADLEAYLFRLEEAAKRDHRKLGLAQRLFHFQEEGPGMVFWHPKGWTLYQIVENFLRGLLAERGYQEIRTPQILDRVLWERSGHWEKFQHAMFSVHMDDKDYAIKPMNCPCHVQVFNQELKSYRDLPLRLSEFGSCHRYEPSGTLHGLMRVRNFVQDDAHIFCTEEQMPQEMSDFIDLVFEAYQSFGFNDVFIKLSMRPEIRLGDDSVWDRAEAALEGVLRAKGLAFEFQPGEGAFYGPKIEFSLKDCLGRVWQCGTLQVDFSLPARLGANYVAEDGSKRTPVMLHRAICGSLERFVGILLEQYAGILPPWLAPHQMVLMSITDAQRDYALDLEKTFKAMGFRVLLDLRNEKIGFKIREHTLSRVPYLLVIGKQEAERGEVAVRSVSGKDLGRMSVAAFADYLTSRVLLRGRASVES